MKGSFSRSAFFSIAATLTVVLSPCLAAQNPAPDAQPETARRQLAMRDAMQEVQEARTAYTEKKYTLAVEHYRNALAVLPDAPAAEKQVRFIKDSLSDALIASAMDYRAVGRSDEAVEFLKEAISLSPKNERARVELSKTEDPRRNNPALTPQHIGNVAEVDRLLTLAYAQMDIGKFDEALAAFRQVLTIDAYNTAAQRGMETVENRRKAYFSTAHDSARAAALAQADALWEDSVPQDVEIADVAEGQTQGEVLEDDEAQSRIATALREMKLPQVTFDDAPVMDVIDALQAQIRRFETSGTSSAGRAVNLTANFGLVGSEGYNDIMGRRVSLNLSDVSLTEVLDALVRQLGVTYHVTPLGVELSYSGKDFGPMVERIYTVSPHFFDAEVGGDDDDDDDDFSSSSRVVVKRVNPVTALKEMGISFPEGANARYDIGSRRLTVRNTPYNQEEIAGLLSIPLDEQSRSVVLNVVAMEVNEKDLNELGFEWLVSMHMGPGAWFGGGGVVTSLAEAGWPEGGNSKAQQKPRAVELSVTDGLRSGSQVISADNMERLIATGSANRLNSANAATVKAPGILSLRGVWQAGDVAMIMRGLSQKKGTDVLYNPRLVLTPGAEQQTTFTNVREMFYPETYSEPSIFSARTGLGDDPLTGKSRSTRSVIATAAHPEEFTRFGMSEDSVGGIGAVVQVHDAQIAQDGQLVTLALTVTLNDFEGFINWGSPIRSFMMTDAADDSTPEQMAGITLTDNHILKPVFKRHMENTKLSVAPGSVIVMGGLQEGRTVRYEDKLPVLGDLPLVGRLFRSEGHEEKKKAFLFFVKVDVVDPAGRDPRTGARPSDFSLAD